MMRKNCRTSAGSRTREAHSTGVTTIDSAAPSAAWVGAALTSSVTLRPSGTKSTSSSARTVAASLMTSSSGARRGRSRARRRTGTSAPRAAPPGGGRGRSARRRAASPPGSTTPACRSRRRTPRRRPARSPPAPRGRPAPAARRGARGRWRWRSRAPARHPVPPRPGHHRLREDSSPPHARPRALGHGAGADSGGSGRGLFAMEDALYGCYLRVGDPGPWAGPLGGGSPASRCRQASAATPAVAAADWAAGWLPGFALALRRDTRA